MSCIFRNRKPMTGRTQRLTQRQMESHTLGWLRMFRAVPGRGETDCSCPAGLRRLCLARGSGQMQATGFFSQPWEHRRCVPPSPPPCGAALLLRLSPPLQEGSSFLQGRRGPVGH